ncbi:hypothetical protein [Geodermatophilus poikilotrophus]|uniref:Uncharacterized protein n=1 Tax=Geodermatophilus poikilotrophus TaxID=1333667 RepID=A0A1I0IS81_9ACTN|nr:hypothetical protein [Geodermatophilus poikilotrophus]SEU00094.1 hypothetical protein SAMN04488546_4613 [Geodermatophilus poikilotrophus]
MTRVDAAVPGHPTRRTPLLRLAAVPVVALAVLLGSAACSGDRAEQATPATGATIPQAGTTSGAPTQPTVTDRSAGEESGGAGAVATDAPRPEDTDVVLSFAVWDPATSSVQASGYVSPLVEDGGTCTLDLTQGDRTVSVSSAALADATTTACTDLVVPGEDLAAGTWVLQLHYASDTAEGTSGALSVEVPA